MLLTSPQSFSAVLRTFADHHDRFVRVSFAEENMKQLYPGFDFSMDDVFSRVEAFLDNGLPLAGRYVDRQFMCCVERKNLRSTHHLTDD